MSLLPFQAGSKISFKCRKNYHILGSTTRTCLENLTWSGVQPECIGKYFLERFVFVTRHCQENRERLFIYPPGVHFLSVDLLMSKGKDTGGVECGMTAKGSRALV